VGSEPIDARVSNSVEPSGPVESIVISRDQQSAISNQQSAISNQQ
jgi:hypothetical protein